MAGTRKGTYKITNWSKYNESLVQRGSITFWFSEDTIDQWHHSNGRPKVGHPFTYSDTAIESLLVLRELFQLPYRQTEGLGKSLARLMQVTVDIPDYTSLAKRAAKLGISLDIRRHKGPIDVVVDSTGLKVFGEGEWKTRKHGISKRRSLSETAMYRMKCCFGDHLKNRLIDNQQTETRIRSKVLNKFTHLGLPQFEWS